MVTIVECAACLCATARADTIVLKNGRQIIAAGVIRENGKVTYETPAGRLSLPESMVAEIRKDSAGMQGGGPTNPAAADISIELPPRQMGADEAQVASLVVREGKIDRQTLARLHAAALSGEANAVARAAAAESAVSQFELQRGNLDQALAHSRRAVALAPAETALLLDISYLHLRRSENAAALVYLERTRPVAPDSADVAKLTGWAQYALNRLPLAVAEWKRAQQLRPNSEVARALEKAERDLEIESAYHQGQSAHFLLRYFGGAAPELARSILRSLEDDFQTIAFTLHYTPSEPIGVVLYTDEAFRDITRAPKWVSALNDGRIRIPVQGLSTVTPELARILKHELTHSFISQKTRERCPVWLQEGAAQWVEGSRADQTAALLVSLYNGHQEPSLTPLEESWMTEANEFAGIAYAWSLAVVEAIIANGGPGDLDRVLDRIVTEPSAEAAVREVLGMTYDDLNRATAEYLRRTYLR